MLGKFCGNTLPLNNSIISDSNTVFVRFRSDGSKNYRGFQLNYTTIQQGKVEFCLILLGGDKLCQCIVNFPEFKLVNSPGFKLCLPAWKCRHIEIIDYSQYSQKIVTLSFIKSVCSYNYKHLI